MKKVLLSTALVASLFAMNNNSDVNAKIEKLQKEINNLKQELINTQVKVNPIAANSHLFFSLDLRTSYDLIHYKLANDKKKGNQIFSNRVILTGVAKPADNLKATVKIEANNIFGMNGNNNPVTLGYDNSSWTANETPDDNTIRLKQAFFNYWFGPNGDGFMFSAGRRPATEGFPANLREGDDPNSPLAHLINMEFDGFSFEIGNDAFSTLSDKFSDWGTWMKFCAGRGYSPNTGKFSQYPYSKSNLKINDFAGFLLIPYDDGQYSLKTETIWSWNAKGLTNPTDPTSMADLGNFFGEDIVLSANGIGDGISDFLDNTTAFISYAFTKTHPFKNKQMLGSPDSKFGSSIWIGADMPGFRDNDRFGVNFVKGTKYWRSMTYGEDTLIGSIAAVRGKAYEAYYNAQIIPHLTAGIRATYIKYDYTGSNGFFGAAGAPIRTDSPMAKAMGAVKHASDIRAYIRYNF